MADSEKRVHPYKDEVQKRVVYTGFKTYEYLVPFNYENVNVVRIYNCAEKHGMEMNPINGYWPDPVQRPSDYIEVIEDEPIVKVEVIGSACTPPGYVQLMFEPCEGFYRPDETPSIVAPRMKIGDLWGMHFRIDQWATSTENVSRWKSDVPYDDSGRPGYNMKTDWHEYPLIGFSSAVFSIPRSKSIKITGGSEVPGWVGDNYACDNHYSFRIIRTTVCTVEQEK
jgi:hypothetical protein